MPKRCLQPQMLKRILLINEDSISSHRIKQFLQQHEFEVDWLTGATFVGADNQLGVYDAILCDISLPDGCGFTLCENWRKSFTGKFILLADSNCEQAHVKGLNLGADDFICKSIKLDLLLAKIRANLRTNINAKVDKNLSLELKHVNAEKAEQSSVINLPSLFINLNMLMLKVNENQIKLTTQELQILYILARNINSKVSREAIFKIVLGKEYDGFDRTVDVYISKLRKKFNNLQGNLYTIKTLWGKGYILTKDHI